MSNKSLYKIKEKPFIEAIQFIGTNADKVLEFGEGKIFKEGNVLFFKTSNDVIRINPSDYVQKRPDEYPLFMVYSERDFLVTFEEKKP